MEVILKVGSRVSVLKLGRGMPQIYLTPGSIKDRRTSQSEPGIGNKSSGGGGERWEELSIMFLAKKEKLSKENASFFYKFFGEIFITNCNSFMCHIPLYRDLSHLRCRDKIVTMHTICGMDTAPEYTYRIYKYWPFNISIRRIQTCSIY